MAILAVGSRRGRCGRADSLTWPNRTTPGGCCLHAYEGHALPWAPRNETLKTHIPRRGFVQRALRQSRAAGRAKDSYEIQMLFGIRMEDQYRYAAGGYAMRDLTAYGEQWYPWYMRRLAERPSNLAFVARNIFTRS